MDHIDYIFRTLGRTDGDDLERCQAAFRGLSPQQMSSLYGESGRTRQEILDGYQINRDRHTAAVAWLHQRLGK